MLVNNILSYFDCFKNQAIIKIKKPSIRRLKAVIDRIYDGVIILPV